MQNILSLGCSTDSAFDFCFDQIVMLQEFSQNFSATNDRWGNYINTDTAQFIMTAATFSNMQQQNNINMFKTNFTLMRN